MEPLLENSAPLAEFLTEGYVQLLPHPSKDGNAIIVVNMLEQDGDESTRKLHSLASLFVIEKAIACSDNPLAAVEIIIDRTNLVGRTVNPALARERTRATYASWHAYYPLRIRKLHIYPPNMVLQFTEHMFAPSTAQGTWERSLASAAQLRSMMGEKYLPKHLGGRMAHEFSVQDVLLPKLKLQT